MTQELWVLTRVEAHQVAKIVQVILVTVPAIFLVRVNVKVIWVQWVTNLARAER